MASAQPQPITSVPLRAMLKRPASDPRHAIGAEAIQPIPRKRRKGIPFLSSISNNDRLFFIDNIATMMMAGLSLSLSLETLIPEARTKRMKRALQSVKFSIDAGGKFSETLKQFPDLFLPLYISVVEVGEAGGTLIEVFAKLAELSKKAKMLRSKILSALLYPAIVVIAMIGILVILMLYVFPQLIAIFEEVNVELPIQTRILIGTVSVFQHYGLYLAGGAIVVVVLFFVGLRYRRFRKFFHRCMLHVPFTGGLWREIVLIRLCGSLKMLLESGVPIVQGLLITARTAGNLVYEDAVVEIAHEVEFGKSLHEVFEKRPRLFPSLVVSLTRVGEGTGKFDEILGKLESFFQTRVENVFANLSTIIEPALLLTVGAAVGFIAVSVIMPIYNLAQAF